MTIQQIEICDRLARLGSFVDTAESLGITQPAVSASLQTLEGELGVRLFLRSRQGVTLTTKGSEILPLMRRILATSQEILQLSSNTPSDRGSLKIAGRQGFMQYVFPELLKELSTRYPRMIVDFVLTGGQAEIVDALLTGRVDLAFGADPAVKSIQAEVMYRDPVLLCESRRRRADKLYVRAFCLPTSADRLRKPLERLVKTLEKHPAIVTESDDYAVLGELVSSGQLAGPIYGHMLLDAQIRRTVRPLTGATGIHRDLTVLVRRDDLLPHVRSAKDLFVAETKRVLDAVLNADR